MTRNFSQAAGVYAPVVTPFLPDLRVASALFIAHCQALQQQNVGLAIFGTNSEATSLTAEERMSLLEQLIASGLDPQRMMPGTGCCALDDTVRLSRHALQHGVCKLLVLPPFFYSGISDDGLFAYYSELVERVGDASARFYLYHIPGFTQVPITGGVIERLLVRYPRVIAGLKDSSGNWNNTRTMLEAFAPAGFDVFCASEIFLSDTLKLGGAGCISATANVNPAGLMRLFECASEAERPALQESADRIRRVFQAYPMIAAMKCYLAQRSGDANWSRVRPPLVALPEADGRALMRQIRDIGAAI